MQYSVSSIQKKTKIQDFRDLIVWQKGHDLVLIIYQLTLKFPKYEIFGIASQIQRCAVSITSNIAEGFARKSKKEKIQFYYTSLGSLSELFNQIIIARDLHYINEEQFNSLEEKIIELRKMINGILKSVQEYK